MYIRYFLVQVDNTYKKGDIVSAQRASERARRWSFAGVVCGVMDFIIMVAIWISIFVIFREYFY